MLVACTVLVNRFPESEIALTEILKLTRKKFVTEAVSW